MTHATVGAHRLVSEGSQLRGSIPDPKTDFWGNLKVLPEEQAEMAYVNTAKTIASHK